MDEETYFGYNKVNKEDKKSLVKEVFSNVAGSYDLMNDVMSLGIHHLWKKFMLTKLSNTKGSLLDVAGGTGDISRLYYNKAKKANNNPDINLCDINNNMLNVARAKLVNHNILNVNYVCGNAEDLPLIDNSFDYYTIAFGIRNVTDITKALEEAYRVLKPGGKFLCLEFSYVENPILSKIYDFYSFNIIPILGEKIAKDRNSYQYLVESIRKFPDQEEFLSMMNCIGFKKSRYINLSLGITALWYGYKI